MRAVDILWRMAYGPKGGGSPTPPTPSGTVIFDGDVEWQEVTEDYTYYLATFVPQNEFQLQGTVTLTLNGVDIEGQDDGNRFYAFPNFDEPMAMIQYADQWMIMSLSEAESHIKIVQAQE